MFTLFVDWTLLSRTLCSSDHGRLGIENPKDVHQPLPDAIDLGTDFPVESVCAGASHTCAKSMYGTTKCLVNIRKIDIIYALFLSLFVVRLYTLCFAQVSEGTTMAN